MFWWIMAIQWVFIDIVDDSIRCEIFDGLLMFDEMTNWSRWDGVGDSLSVQYQYYCDIYSRHPIVQSLVQDLIQLVQLQPTPIVPKIKSKSSFDHRFGTNVDSNRSAPHNIFTRIASVLVIHTIIEKTITYQSEHRNNNTNNNTEEASEKQQ